MPLMPKRVKYRKNQRKRIKGSATRGNRVSLGDFGIQALQGGWIPANVIEACRIAANQYIRGDGKLFIRIFPHKPVTARPLETRMGTGKGEPDHWVAVVKPGRILFELAGVPVEEAEEAMGLAGHKLPVNVKFVVKEGVVDGHR